MELSPQQVPHASFKSAKGLRPRRGRRPSSREVAEALEAAQNQATAMEARARAAVARLQEVAAAGRARPTPARRRRRARPVDEAETISRTLLLAQRTADATVADAPAEAERIVAAARAEAAATLDSTREMSAKLLEEARSRGPPGVRGRALAGRERGAGARRPPRVPRRRRRPARAVPRRPA